MYLHEGLLIYFPTVTSKRATSPVGLEYVTTIVPLAVLDLYGLVNSLLVLLYPS